MDLSICNSYIVHLHHIDHVHEIKFFFSFPRVNNESSSKAAKVRKFCLLPRDFSISGGELGPTMKVKRHAVEAKYKKEIEEMYATSDRTSLWDT